MFCYGKDLRLHIFITSFHSSRRQPITRARTLAFLLCRLCTTIVCYAPAASSCETGKFVNLAWGDTSVGLASPVLATVTVVWRPPLLRRCWRLTARWEPGEQR